ncbi:MAG: hypothetical protein J6P21_00760 [Clostridia bacterium]|nr:hypothetical protein [Clostridia bacterium]
MSNKNSLHFFLASNSPQGFFSKMNIFSENLPVDWKCNIIKGSPGCGKSTYMKKLAKEIEKMGLNTEYIYCPSDPDSLDAVIFSDLKLCYVDGTAPHVIDPIFPGISGEIIDLGKLKNINNISKNKEKIFELDKTCKEFYNRAQKYLIAFSSVLSSSIEYSAESIDTKFVKKISEKISKKFFKKSLQKCAKQSIRLISSIGPKGLLFLDQNLKLYEHVYQINDDLNLISNVIFKNILNLALEKNYNAIVCLNPLSLSEKIEALVIPELSLAFVALNRWQKFSSNEKNLKFTPIDISELKSQIISEDVETLDLLILKAVKCMKNSFDVHTSLEKIYS